MSGGLYAIPLEMAIQSAEACSEAKDGGLLASADGVRPSLGCILKSCCGRWFSFFLFFFFTDKRFDFSVGQM